MDARDESTESSAEPREFEEMVAAARAGSVPAMSAVRAWLDEHPRIWQESGDIAHQTELVWLELIVGDDPLTRELLSRKAQALREELAGQNPSPIVRLLAQRVVSSWLQAYHADATAARNREVSVPVAKLLLERQDRASRRYAAALAELARVRKLLGAEARGPAGASANRAEGQSKTAVEVPRLALFGGCALSTRWK